MTGTDRATWTNPSLRTIASEFADSTHEGDGEIPVTNCRALIQFDGSATAGLAEVVSVGRAGLTVRTKSPSEVDARVTVRFVGTRSAIDPLRLRVAEVERQNETRWLIRLAA